MLCFFVQAALCVNRNTEQNQWWPSSSSRSRLVSSYKSKKNLALEIIRNILEVRITMQRFMHAWSSEQGGGYPTWKVIKREAVRTGPLEVSRYQR